VTGTDVRITGTGGDVVDVTIDLADPEHAGWRARVDPGTAPAAGVWEPGEVTVELVADGRVAAAHLEIGDDGHVVLVGATPFSGGGA
jgi:hypothetical protein